MSEFNDFDEFMLKRENIKNEYTNLCYAEKRQYKKYIYNLDYKDTLKDAIWCFLNEITGEFMYELELLEIYRIYKKNKKAFNGRS